MRVKPLVNVYHLDCIEQIPIFWFLKMFKLLRNAIRISERAAMLGLPYNYHETLEIAVRIDVCAEDKPFSIGASMSSIGTRSQKHLRMLMEEVKYPLKIYATDEAIGQFDTAILCHMQQSSPKFWQYVNDLTAKLWKIADVYRESILIAVFI